MLGQVVFVAQKWAHTAQLQNALTAIHHGQLITAHQLVTEFLERCAIGRGIAACVRSVEAVNGFLAQCFR